MFANRYVEKLKPYKLISHKAWEIEDKSNVLKLDWNEATIPPSPKVKEYLNKFLRTGNLNWYPNINNKRLLTLLADYVKLPVENIQYFGGSDSLHEYVVKTFLDPGEEVIIVAPTYDNFRAVAQASGCLIDFYYLDDHFRFDVDNFINYLKLRSPKMVYICNPNNPTGTVYNPDIIENLINKFPEIFFVIDEAYYEFTGVSCKDLVLRYDNLLISRTFSKAFALASFRIGYAIASRFNIEMISKVRNPKNITTFSQLAAIAALEDIDYMENYVKKVNEAKVWFKRGLEELNVKVLGDSGNFVLLYIGKEKKERLIKFLEKNYIFVRDYSHVKGMEDYIRITVGTRNQMEKVLEKIKEFFMDSKE